MKRNPWKAKQDEIAELKRQLDEYRAAPFIRKFAGEVGEAIMTILATKPLDQWPTIAQMAYQHCADQTPTSAWIYLQHLPDE